MALNGLKDFIDTLDAFDFEVSMSGIILDNKDVISNMVAEQLGSTSLDGNGNPVTLDGGGYADSTIRYKQEFGQGLGAITDRVTLFQTGELYRMIDTEVVIDEVQTMSDVPYYDELMARTGEDVMKLNESNRLDFATEILMPAFSQEFLDKTGLQIT